MHATYNILLSYKLVFYNTACFFILHILRNFNMHGVRHVMSCNDLKKSCAAFWVIIHAINERSFKFCHFWRFWDIK